MRLLSASALFLPFVLPTRAAAQVSQPASAPREQVIAAAKDVIQTARYATLVTIGEDGHPQARIVDPFVPEGDDFTIWIGTNSRTRKAGEIGSDPRVTLLYFNASDAEYVTVLGRATLVADSSEEARHWKPEWAPFYRDGYRSDNYLLIRVRPIRLEIVSPRHGLVNDPRSWRPVIVSFP